MSLNKNKQLLLIFSKFITSYLCWSSIIGATNSKYNFKAKLQVLLILEA